MNNNIRVSHIINDFKVALNVGSADDVCLGDRFQIYTLSKTSIEDPATGLDLGKLEIVKGTGVVTSVQKRLCTIESDSFENGPKRIIRKKSPFAIGAEQIEEVFDTLQRPFDSPEIGDYAKKL